MTVLILLRGVYFSITGTVALVKNYISDDYVLVMYCANNHVWIGNELPMIILVSVLFVCTALYNLGTDISNFHRTLGQ